MLAYCVEFWYIRSTILKKNDSDFKWDEAYKFAQTIGLIEKGEYEDRNATFKRADVVLITYSTMKSTTKNGNQTLAEAQGITLKDVQRGTTPYWRPALEDVIDERYLGITDTSDPDLWRVPGNAPEHGSGFIYRMTNVDVLSGVINQYDPNLSAEENLEKFCDIINGLNNTNNQVKIVRDANAIRLNFNLDGRGWANAVTMFSYHMDTGICNFGGHTCNTWGTNGEGKNQIYNNYILSGYDRVYEDILAFFDYDMAVRYHAMMTDYFMNTDAWIEIIDPEEPWFTLEEYDKKMTVIYHGDLSPITPEFASRYGLTYLDGGRINDWGENYIRVTNGNLVLYIEYKAPSINLDSFASVKFSLN